MGINDKYWCAFGRLEKCGPVFIDKLYSHFGSIEAAWNADKADLYDIEGLTGRQISVFLEERKNINPEQSLEYIRNRGIDLIHPEDSRYPYLLRFIDGAPVCLFMKGDIKLCNPARTLAAAGSRRASESGKAVLYKILSEFKGTDICIVSGLAEGMDTTAHKSALNNDLKTIAVLGGGFDRLYPKSNAGLFNEIIDGRGAVLTEYWCDAPAVSRNFPVRNRIITGMSKGVLIAEAALKSGAMITARLAGEQGKELMCIPGLISNPNTEGIYKLLKEGASMVTCAQDILDAMNWTIENSAIAQKAEKYYFDEDEKLVIEAVKIDALTLDGLIIKTGLNINDLMPVLTKLELEGAVSQTSGGRYIYTA